MLFTIFILVVSSFDSNIRFVYFRAKGMRARVYFPATYVFVFYSPNCSNSVLLCFFVKITKDKPP